MPKTRIVNTESTLHTLGYEVHRKLAAVPQHAIEDLRARARQRSSVIFNTYAAGDSHVGDGRRKQMYSLRNKVTKPFFAQLDASLKSLAPSHQARAWVLVHSEAGCAEQTPHADYQPTRQLAQASDAEMPLAVLVAVMPQTRLEIWPRSIGWMASPEQPLCALRAAKQTLELGVGDVLLFRGDLVHASSADAAEHVRLHCFLDNPAIRRTANKTCHVDAQLEPDGLHRLDPFGLN